MIVNGKVVNPGLISPLDRGFTLGDGIFETIPLYDRKPFLLDKHLERMKDGASMIGIELPFDKAIIEDGIQALSSQIESERGVARLTVTRGQGGRGYDIGGFGEPTWTLTCDLYRTPEKALYKKGAKLSLVSITKNPKSPLNKIKSTSALERILILAEAKKSGAFEAISLTTDGSLSSGAAVNIFWVTGGQLRTPSLECAILPGVTRQTIIDIAAREGATALQGRFGIDEINQAEEVFITNSLIGIAPVKCVGNIFKSSRPGAVTTSLAQKYSELTGAI